MFRLRGIDTTHSEADMDEHPVADAGFDRATIDDAADVDLAADAANIDGGRKGGRVIDTNNAAGDAQAHVTPHSSQGWRH